MGKLDGKVAIVTGAARGIGRAIAKSLASEGASVVVNDILIDPAQQVVDEIIREGGTAHFLKADATQKAEVQLLVQHVVENFKAVHVLVNNVGDDTGGIAPIVEMKEETWDKIQHLNLKSQFLYTQAVLKHMVKQRYGKIINIASICGVHSPLVGYASYSAAKAGVCQLAKITAMETSRYGINVNAIAPGLIVTTEGELALKGELGKEVKDRFERLIKAYGKRSALGRVGTPQDVANLALFLASDDSSFITGQVILCDGGHLLGRAIGGVWEGGTDS